MSGECRPPVGTRDGAHCVLAVDTDSGTMLVILRWHGEWQNRHGQHIPLPSEFRFHSLATPPEDKP